MVLESANASRDWRWPVWPPPGRFYVLHGPLHGSGFGNQVGMLLQHLAIARRAERAVVLPSIGQPREHRAAAKNDDDELAPEEVFDLTSLSSLSAPALTRREFGRLCCGWKAPPPPLPSNTSALLTFSSTLSPRATPLRLAAPPLPAPLAVAQLLRLEAWDGGCEEEDGGGGHGACASIGYCHLPDCAARTRRWCRRKKKRGGAECARASPRLPNNYLFGHRLPPLLCGRAVDGDDAALAPLHAAQRDVLRTMELARPLRAAATRLAKSLGGGYSAVHLRLPDASAGFASRQKGLNVSALPALLQSLAPALRSGSRRRRLTVYVASNRPSKVAEARGALEEVLGRAVGSGRRVRVVGWTELSRDWADGAPPRGLRAALVEHELCVRAPGLFAGSPWSTWANLIGARRVARGVADAAAAYVDLHTSAPAVKCDAIAS